MEILKQGFQIRLCHFSMVFGHGISLIAVCNTLWIEIVAESWNFCCNVHHASRQIHAENALSLFIKIHHKTLCNRYEISKHKATPEISKHKTLSIEIVAESWNFCCIEIVAESWKFCCNVHHASRQIHVENSLHIFVKIHHKTFSNIYEISKHRAKPKKSDV